MVLDRISENMALLVQSGMYGVINTDENTSNWLYFVQFLLEAYTLQNNTIMYGKVISSGELVVKTQYLCYMQYNTN